LQRGVPSVPVRQAIAQLTLRCASCSIGFRRVETDKPKGLARNPNRVAVQHLNLTGIERWSIRNRGDKGENESERANHSLAARAAYVDKSFARGEWGCPETEF
jgi:hypothetical protein